jgi:hypothetical protein
VLSRPRIRHRQSDAGSDVTLDAQSRTQDAGQLHTYAIEYPPEPALRPGMRQANKGTATVTLTDTVTIPAESGSRVNVMLSIFIDGSNTTSQLKQVTYEVR